ncbi:hypothetical protein BG000_006143 [Podila horticola]|nr:hypothetical protein BG000_006143 [Podila horticola]
MRFSAPAIACTIFLPVLAVATEPKIVEVTIVDGGFDPSKASFQPPEVAINVGDTVRWTNKGSLPHTVNEGSTCWDLFKPQSFTSGLIYVNSTFTHTFDKAGEFQYYCMPHCYNGYMKGKVIVT